MSDSFCLNLQLIAIRHTTSADFLTANPDIAHSLMTGGMLWFTDLTTPDTTMILPVTLGLVNLLNIEVCMHVSLAFRLACIVLSYA